MLRLGIYSGSGLLVFGVVFAASLLVGQFDDDEAIEVDSMIDMGEVWPGERSKFDVEVRNGHPSKPFRITRVATSCACTVAEVTRRVIDPGQSVVVSGYVSFGSSPGRFPVSVVVQGTVGESGETIARKCRISGTIVDLVHLDRRAIDFRWLDAASGIVRRKLILRRGAKGRDLFRLRVDVPPGYGALVVNIQYPDTEHVFAEISFILDSKAQPPGAFSTTVGIEFLDRGGNLRGEKDVVVCGNKLREVTVVPCSLMVWPTEERKLGREDFELLVQPVDTV